MTDDSGADCPHCGTPGRRLFFPAGIVFKGSGFYKTDSRRSSSASVNGGGPSAPSKPAGETAAPAGEKTSGTEKGSAATKPVAGGEASSGGSTRP
jgi:hypothetical protein